MQNILYYYSSQQIHTGSPRVMMRLIEGLDRSCFSSKFLAGHEGDLCRELVNKGTEIIQGETHNIGTRSFYQHISNIRCLIRMLKREQISLVHVNELGWNTELALAAFLGKIPVIFHIHNPETLNKRNINCRIGTKYLFVSHSLARQCDAESRLGGKAEILYNPISVETFSQGKSIRSELGVPDNVHVVGTVAQICKRKGIDIFIATAVKLLKILPDTYFLVAGPDVAGEEDYAAEMRRRVRDEGMDKQFKFCGTRDDINNFLASLDIFFLPTRAEPFGMVIAEAMSARVPVVTSNVGGIPEIIPDRSFGVTADIEDNFFHQIIAKLLTETGRRESMAERGFERVNSLFSDSIFNNRIKQLYHLTTKRRSARAGSPFSPEVIWD